MREQPTQAPAASSASRRKAVGKAHPGVYERTNGRGQRVLEVDYYDETGRRRWHTLPPGSSLKQAQAAREDLRAKRRRGERFAPTKAPTVAECWQRWHGEAAIALRKRTADNYGQAFSARIVPRLGSRRVNALDRRDVLGLIRDLQGAGLAAWTIRGTLVPFGRFLSWAEDEGFRTGNPVRDLRRSDRPRVGRKQHRNLTDVDVWRLVDAADEDRRAFVGLLAFAGLRLSEALAVVWGDVDLDDGVVQVCCQLEHGTLARVEPKTTAAVRDVEVGEDFVSILRGWKLRSRFSGPSNFVVTTASGAPLDQRGASRRLDWIVKQAGLDVEGLPRITPHQLRYTYGSLLLEAGGQPATVSRLMGHTNISITQGIYQHEIVRRDSADRTRETMRQAFSRGTDLGTVMERRGEQSRATAAAASGSNVASLGG